MKIQITLEIEATGVTRTEIKKDLIKYFDKFLSLKTINNTEVYSVKVIDSSFPKETL